MVGVRDISEGLTIQLLPLILDHNQARNLLPLVFIPYLLRRWYPGRVDRFFKALMVLVILAPMIWASGLFVQGTWSSVWTPLSYASAILAIYLFTLKVDGPSYAAVLALHAAAVAGWLYEVPRYMMIGAPILRFNRGSFFTVDYSICSILVVFVLLLWKGWRPRVFHIPFLYVYVLFFKAYMDQGFLLDIRLALGTIAVFRVPALIMMIGLCLFGEDS